MDGLPPGPAGANLDETLALVKHLCYGPGCVRKPRGILRYFRGRPPSLGVGPVFVVELPGDEAMTLTLQEHPMREAIRRLIRARGPMGISEIAKEVKGKIGQVGY